jgi:hypothetical protein
MSFAHGMPGTCNASKSRQFLTNNHTDKEYATTCVDPSRLCHQIARPLPARPKQRASFVVYFHWLSERKAGRGVANDMCSNNSLVRTLPIQRACQRSVPAGYSTALLSFDRFDKHACGICSTSNLPERTQYFAIPCSHICRPLRLSIIARMWPVRGLQMQGWNVIMSRQQQNDKPGS